MSNHTTPPTVLGLGAMGSTLAAVWNRSPTQAGPLAVRGATAAAFARIFEEMRSTR
jgi:hypothetical protein